MKPALRSCKIEPEGGGTDEKQTIHTDEPGGTAPCAFCLDAVSQQRHPAGHRPHRHRPASFEADKSAESVIRLSERPLAVWQAAFFLQNML